MKRIAILPVLLILVVFAVPTSAAEVKKGDKVTIVTPGTTARLCPYANCGKDQAIACIPEGTVLKVESITDVKLDMFPGGKWFEVTHQGYRGWISIFDTNKAR
jgi:hypothetical protein